MFAFGQQRGRHSSARSCIHHNSRSGVRPEAVPSRSSNYCLATHHPNTVEISLCLSLGFMIVTKRCVSSSAEKRSNLVSGRTTSKIWRPHPLAALQWSSFNDATGLDISQSAETCRPYCTVATGPFEHRSTLSNRDSNASFKVKASVLCSIDSAGLIISSHRFAALAGCMKWFLLTT